MQTGEEYKRRLPAFGEAVLYMKVHIRMRKLLKYEDRWEPDLFLDLVARNRRALCLDSERRADGEQREEAAGAAMSRQ